MFLRFRKSWFYDYDVNQFNDYGLVNYIIAWWSVVFGIKLRFLCCILPKMILLWNSDYNKNVWFFYVRRVVLEFFWVLLLISTCKFVRFANIRSERVWMPSFLAASPSLFPPTKKKKNGRRKNSKICDIGNTLPFNKCFCYYGISSLIKFSKLTIAGQMVFFLCCRFSKMVLLWHFEELKTFHSVSFALICELHLICHLVCKFFNFGML